MQLSSNIRVGYERAILSIVRIYQIATLLPCKCCVVFVFLLVGVSILPAQVNMDNSCGFDSFIMEEIQNNAIKKYEFDKLNRQVLDYQLDKSSNARLGTNNVLPVVVHLITPFGTDIGMGNNLTDEQVRDGIALLNQSFLNEGAFFNEEGVNTEIQFCLASRSPEGQPTNGITRTESNLVSGDTCTPGGTTNATDANTIKALVNWPCDEYINIWLVTDLYNENLGCGLAGFATLPTIFCGNTDGIMQESRYWITLGGTAVTAHEMGHYLGLLHTFNGGCTNDDCTLDGDLICDTPPDNTQGGSCISNSCDTDVPDLLDDSNNYMDYTSCTPLRFTEGQKSRMQAVLATTRSTLCESPACSPVLNHDLAVSILSSQNLQCDPIICPDLIVRNLGLDTIRSFLLEYDITGYQDLIYMWSGTLLPNEKIEISLACSEIFSDTFELQGTVTEVNGTLDENPMNNIFSASGEINQSPILGVVLLVPTDCLSNGVAVLSVNSGIGPYTFTLDGFVTSQITGNFALLPSGNYECIVEDAIGCRDTLSFEILNNCSFASPDEFIINGDAFSTGNQCFTLTRELVGQAGSIWYQSKIDLREDFQVAFSINLGDKNFDGADGVAFLLQPISTAIGSSGGGIGYLGVSPSFACEFDTYQNFAFNDPFYDHIGIQTDGVLIHNSPNNLFGPVPIKSLGGIPINVEDGTFYDVSFQWDARFNTFKVDIDCEIVIDLNVDLINDVFNGDPEVFFGFTSATGGLSNVHQVCLNHISFLDSLPNVVLCKGDSIRIELNPIFENFEWAPSQNITGAETATPIFSPEVSTWYKVKMDDGCGFEVYDSLFVEVLDYDFSILLETEDGCDPSTSHQIIVDILPYVSDLEYSLDGINYSADSIFTDLSPGIYSVFVKKGNCLQVSNIIIEPQNTMTDTILFIRNPNCQNPLGVIQVEGVGGMSPYNYSINGNAPQDNGLFENLSAGVYEIVIIDQDNCRSQLDFILTDQLYDFELEIVDADLNLTCDDISAYVLLDHNVGVGQILYYLDDEAASTEDYFDMLSSGPHTIYALDENGCYSDTLDFMVILDSTQAMTFISVEECPGGFTLFGGITYEESGTYTDTLSGANGCDSIVVLEFLVFDTIIQSISAVICAGDTYLFNTNIYDTAGVYLDTLVAINGCDSIVLLDLAVVDELRSERYVQICDGESFVIGNQDYNQSGMYMDTLYSQITGCDSIITTVLEVLNTSESNQSISLCYDESYMVGSSIYSVTGVYIDILVNTLGCDSIVVSELNFEEENILYESYSLCEGDSLLIRGEYYNSNGLYELIISDGIQCDTTLEIEIILEDISICDNKYCKSYIPNIFSPNQDNTNDLFTVFTDAVIFEELFIYDRWGELIHHSTQDDLFWDGRFNGENAIEGVYVYLLLGTCVTGEEIKESGSLTLIR